MSDLYQFATSPLGVILILGLAWLHHELIALAIHKGADLLHHLIDALKRRR